ncbi:MAG: zinc ribbon domain-containing protein [Methanobrevibacter sp.]|nr:zinc ribbon domain-containing protein [Methanobrevibacter sp.]
MPKYCPKCGTDNDDKFTFCRNCGERLSGINTVNNNDSVKSDNNKILMGAIVALIIVIAIIGTYVFIGGDNDSNINTVSDSSVSDSSNVNTKSWHKIDSFHGVGDYSITLNVGVNPIKIVSSAMPTKNYASNFMETTVGQYGYTVGSSLLSWESNSALAKKSENIEFSGSGTYFIYISAYELQYWDLEIYEYY